MSTSNQTAAKSDGAAADADLRANTIEELLARRGVPKNQKFNDYQDYLEQRQASIRPRMFLRHGISSTGSMHLALGRVCSTRDFKY